MPIKQVFESREEAPEFLQEALVEEDGKFVFEAELPNETAGLKSALEKERKAKAEIEKTLKAFEGIDVERAKQLLGDAERIEADKLKAKGDWEAREKQLTEKFQAQVEQLQDAIAKSEQKYTGLERELENYLVESEATTAIASAKGVPQLLLPHLKTQVRVVNEDGKRLVRVMQGDTVRLGNLKGEPMTVNQLVEEMRASDVFGRAFEPVSPGGSGAQPGTKAGGLNGYTITREEAKDPYKYRAAREAAQKAGQELQIVD